jgi:hypothetical protein
MTASQAIAFPRLVRVRQRFATVEPLDLPCAIEATLSHSGLASRLRPGSTVAVGVGSRGIDRLPEIVRAVLEWLRGAGAQPFLFAAMGSHGGATPAGQARLLADYGITPETMCVPLDTTLETDPVGQTTEAFEVHCARSARSADAVLLINRVKPHTDFGGALGSGLLKMAVVGMGKHTGASSFHRAAQQIGHERALRSMASVVLAATRLAGGLALIEDPRHQLARVEFVPARDLEQAETRLAAEAAALMPRLPVEQIDLLIVDRMGKNLSGTGMDPNVIGRMIHGYSLIESELPTRPRIRRLFVRDLTPESHGNATGLGMADFTTNRLVQAMDRHATYTNALTALSLQGAKIPIHFATDREAITAALSTLGLPDTCQARVVRIQDTLSLETLLVSEACRDELHAQPHVQLLGEPAELSFGPDGNLAD